MAQITCPGCLQKFDEDVLIDRLQKDKVSGHDQRSTPCPNCRTVIYRVAKGKIRTGIGNETLPINGRVPCSREQQAIMERNDQWPPSDWPEYLSLAAERVPEDDGGLDYDDE